MAAPASIPVTPYLVADLVAAGEPMPLNVHVQVVVIETDGRPVIVGGDVAVWFGELEEPESEGQLRVLALEPELVWLAHEHEPWRPRTG